MAIHLDGATYLEIADPILKTKPVAVLFFAGRDIKNVDQVIYARESSATNVYSGVQFNSNSDTALGFVRSSVDTQVAYATQSATNSTMRLGIHEIAAGAQYLYYGSSTLDSGSYSAAEEGASYDRLTIGAIHKNGEAAAAFLQGDVSEFHFLSALPSASDYTAVANGTKRPEELAGHLVGFPLKDVNNLTDLSGTRTLTIVGSGATTSAATHPVSRTAATGGTVNLTSASSTQANTSSTGVATVTPAGSTSGTITSDTFKDFTGQTLVNFTVPNVMAIKLDRTVALSLANQVTNSSGVLSITNAALVAGTPYMLATFSADGTARGMKKVIAT